MYLKLNFNGNVSWGDVFNIMRYVLINNVTTISAIKSAISSINSTPLSLINESTSEIYRDVSPGVGYNKPLGIWGYNWPIGSSIITTPEIVIKRKVSTYEGGDTEGDYYIRVRFDGNHLYTGCYRSINGTLIAGVNGTNSIFNYADGEESISGFNMSAGLTSLFWYITPTSMMISGKGPTGSYTSTGWISPSGTRIGNQAWLASQSIMTLQNANYVIADGSRIYFQPPVVSTNTSSGAISTATGTYYYARNGVSNTFSVATNLYNLHTASYITNVASATNNDIIVEGLMPHNPSTNTVSIPPVSSTFTLSVPASIQLAGSYIINTTAITGVVVGQTVSLSGYISSGTIVIGIFATGIIISQPIVTNIPAGATLTFTRVNVAAQAHFGPSFISEFKPYDATAITSNDYIPVMYSVGYIQNTIGAGSQRCWYGMNSQDFMYADPYHCSKAYKILSIKAPTPNLTGTWTTTPSAEVYIGTDLRTIERAPLGDEFYSTTTTDRTLGAALVDRPGYKFPDENLQPSYGLFPLTWSGSHYNTAGGKLTPELSGFMLFNGKYDPDDYFTYSGNLYALWPLADGHHRNIGIAVPKK